MPMQTKVLHIRTYQKTLEDGSVLIAVAEIKKIGDQRPYFSMTAELYDRDYIRGEAHVTNEHGKRRYLGSFGTMDEEVIKHFPFLLPYIKWHLTSTSGPMHYIENALYWAGFYPEYNSNNRGARIGQGTPPIIKYLMSTIIYGVVPGDEQFNLDKLVNSAYRLGAGHTEQELKSSKLRRSKLWLARRQSLIDFLTARLDTLMAQYNTDMKELFGLR